MKRVLSVIAGFFALSGMAAAQYPQPPIEAYGELPIVSMAEISPDGTTVAVIANRKENSEIIVFDDQRNIVRQGEIEDFKPRSLKFLDQNHILLTTYRTVHGAYKTRYLPGDNKYRVLRGIHKKTQPFESTLRASYSLESGKVKPFFSSQKWQ